MNWYYSPYALFLLIAAIFSITLALHAWQRRATHGATMFALLMFAVAQMVFGYALELSTSDLETRILWAKVQYIGLTNIPPAWFIFAISYSGRLQWISGRNILPILIIPKLTLLLVWTNEYHHLIWQTIALADEDPFLGLSVQYGPWFWVHLIHSYALILTGTGLLIGRLIRTPQLYGQQIAMLLIAVLVPLLYNSLYIFRPDLLAYFDLTPLAFTLTGIALLWSLFRFRLLDIAPVARDAIFENMYAGVIVLDTRQRIVDINPAAQQFFNWSNTAVVGRELSEVLPSLAAVLPQGTDSPELRKNIVLAEDPEQRIFELIFSYLRNRYDHPAGSLAILRDITEHKQAEASLRESEARYRAVSELTSDFTYALRAFPDGSVDLDWITDAFFRMTDYSAEEVRAHGGWQSLVHPDDQAITNVHTKKLYTGRPDVAEFRIITKSGETLWIRNYGQSVRGEDRRRVVRILGAGQNITEQKQVEAALRESEERYRRLVEYSPEPIAVYSEEKIVYVNTASVKLYGAKSPDELIGRSIWDFIHPDYRDRAMVQARHIQQQNSPADLIEEKLIRLDGQSIDVEIATIPTTYLGKPAIQVVARDITARKRVEETLREQNEYFAALHDTALAVMNRLEVQDVLETIVVRAGALVGTEHGYLYSDDDGSGTSRIKVGVGVFRSYVGCSLQPGVGVDGMVWSTGQPLVVNKYQQWSGRMFDEAAQSIRAAMGVPLTSGSRVIGVLGLAHIEAGKTFGSEEMAILTRFAELASIAMDNARLYTTAQQELAERKRAEEDLAQARDQALEAARMKTEFLATMSHELRTPLNAIIGFTDLTLEPLYGTLNEQQRSNLQRVSRNARHLLELIDGILDLSKIEAAHMQMINEPVRLYEVVSSAVSNIETLVTKKQIQLTIYQASMAMPLIRGDSGRLRQIVLNLLTNAVKFTPAHGQINIVLEHGTPDELTTAAKPEHELPSGQWIALSVQDSGIGIPPHEHVLIWNEFYQIDGSTTREYSGTGLGLAIVRRFTQLMGGHVGLRSAVGEGSTFTIWLPLTEASTVQTDVESPAALPLVK